MHQVSLHGRVALVTGGSRGLGRAMVLGLAQAGADVVIASRKLESCQQLAAEVEALGRRALPFAAHAGRMESLDALLDATYAHFGRLDILINNAGTNPVTAGLSELTPELFEKVFAVNTKGPWYLASRAAPRMAAHGGGSIINIISVGGLKPPAYQGFYAGSKAALHAMTKVMASSATAHAGRTVPGGTRLADAEDFSHVIATLQTGASVAITVSRVARGLNEHSLEVYGERGALAMRQTRTGEAWHLGELRAASGSGLFEPVDIPHSQDGATLSKDRLELTGQSTIRPMVEQFVAAIESGRPATPSLQDGASAQAVLDAVIESSQSGHWVAVAMPEA
jgi:NADP-dependent 3-hydroxy acid dehydrogenase YdfG